MKLAEGKLAVKIQRYERVLSRPFDCWCLCHEARLSDFFQNKKLKNLAEGIEPGQVYMPEYE
jgi:hypothetical protein